MIAGMGHRETICAAATTEETVFPIVSLSHSHVHKKKNHVIFCSSVRCSYLNIDKLLQNVLLHVDTVDRYACRCY